MGYVGKMDVQIENARPRLERFGDQEDLYIAERRLTELDAGRITAVPLDDVIASLGLED